VTRGNEDASNAHATPLSTREYLPKLREFYARGKAIYDQSRSDKLGDSDVDMRFKEFMAWANEAGVWMNVNMNSASTNRFTTWHIDMGMHYKLLGSHSQVENNKFSALNAVLPQLLENLRLMATPDAVDPQKSRSDYSK